MIVVLECKECYNGTVTDPTGNCSDNSNECCGGCDKQVDCNDCEGGFQDVDLNEYFDGEISTIGITLESMFDDLVNRGVSKSESKKLLRKIVKEQINNI